jgi:hypothetical protein
LHLGERLLHFGEEPPSISEHLGMPVTFESRDQLAVARDPELLLEDQLFCPSYSDSSFQAERRPT